MRDDSREELLHATLESTADGIIVVNEAGQIAHMNNQFISIWKLPEDAYEITDGKALVSFLEGQLDNPHDFGSILLKGGKDESETKYILHFKDDRVFECFSRSFFHGEGMVEHVWSFRDLTERIWAENMLLEHRDFLEKLVKKRTTELEQTNRSLQEEVDQREEMADLLQEQSNELTERVKELNCLFGMSKLVESGSNSFDDIMQGIIRILPAGFRHSEVICARLILGDKEYLTYNFKETEWRMSSDIVANGETQGIIEIFSLKDPLAIGMEMFPKENTYLLDAIAERIVRIIEQDKAERQIKQSLHEKEILLKEIHHRVKNNMQIISSLLNLQSRHVKDENAFEMFKQSQTRVRSMALVHEKLYQSKELDRMSFQGYAQNLANFLLNIFGVDQGRVKVEIDAGEITMDINMAVPCGLLINELISNCLKHAFPEGKGTIYISLKQAEDDLILTVKDDGVGFPEDKDFRKTRSLGMQLVNNLTDQLEGEVELVRGGGTTFVITFPIQGSSD
jgi:two-component sensor histidine kinase